MPTKPTRLRAFAALLTALCLLITFTTAQAQSTSVIVPVSQTGSVGINTDGSTADASALLDVKSTTQGVLVPRMNAAQRGLISTPATGLLVYQTDAPAGFYFYNGTAWTSLSSAGATGPKGDKGDTGAAGTAGQGVPVGGTTGQVLSKINGTDYNTQWTTPSGGGSAGVVTVFAAQKNTQQNTNLTGSGGTNTVPDVITFENVTTSPATGIGSWDASTSTYTVGANGSGWYLVSVQLTENNVTTLPMVEVNPGGATASNPVNANSLFGTSIGNNGTVAPYRFRGVLQNTVFLSANTTLRVRSQPTSTVIGNMFNGDASCFFRLMKLN